MIDAYTVVGRSALGSWDYLGAMLVCTEGGGRAYKKWTARIWSDLAHERRSVAAAATPALLSQVERGCTRRQAWTLSTRVRDVGPRLDITRLSEQLPMKRCDPTES